MPDLIHLFERGSGELTLLLLHGTGGDENDLLPLGRQVAPGANLLSPRGSVLESGMPRFFRRIAPGVFDTEDLEVRTLELARFIQEAGSEYGFDPGKVVAVGYSNGANIAASLLYLAPWVLAGAALLHAMIPFPDRTPADLDGYPVLLTGGSRDAMIPGEETLRLGEALQGAGAEVEIQMQPGGHELTHAEVQTLMRWIKQLDE